MKALVLAAGKGTRLKPLTDNLPKAMVLLHGKPLLEHALVSLKKAGIKRVVVVVGYLKQKIIDYFGSNFEGVQIEYVEQKEQLGTAHAVLQAKRKMDGNFLVASADVIAAPILWKKLAAKKGFDAVVALRKEKNPKKFGVAAVRGKLLEAITEKPLHKTKSNLVNAGAYFFSQKIFAAIAKTKKSAHGEFELTDAINFLAQKKKAGFIKFGGKILDIGSLSDLKNAEKEPLHS